MSRAKPGSEPDRAPISMAALAIVRAAMRPDIDIGELAQLAASDPGFAVRIMALVNGPAFGFSRSVVEVKQAVSCVGVRGLKNLALSLALSDMVPPGPESEVLLANSLRRAAAARLVAEHLGHKDVDEFFTAGLLLEVGLLSRARTDRGGAAAAARTPASHRIVFERSAGHDDHAAEGARIAESFSLPAELVQAVEHHHDRDPAPGRIARVTWAAERIAAVWEGGDLAAARAEAERSLEVLGLSPRAALSLLESMPARFAESAQAFDRELDDQPPLDALLLDVNRQLVAMNASYEDLVRRLEGLIAEKDELSRKLQEANELLANQASTDALTGLPNKRALDVAFGRDWARSMREQTWLSVIVCDVDFFKRVNDQHGHQAGDKVLRSLAECFTSQLRASDLAARFGGEEFVLLLPNTHAASARIVAERIRRAIEGRRIDVGTTTLQVTASFGIAATKGGAEALKRDELFERADAALYEAKKAGRNRTVIAHVAEAGSPSQPVAPVS